MDNAQQKDLKNKQNSSSAQTKNPATTNKTTQSGINSRQSPIKTSSINVKPGVTTGAISKTGGTKPTMPKTGVQRPISVNQNAIKNPSTAMNNSAQTLKPKVQEINSKDVSAKSDDSAKKKKKKKLVLLILLILLICVGIGTAIFFITRIPKTDIRFSVVTKITINTELDSVGEQTYKPYFPGDVIKGDFNIKIVNDKGRLDDDENVYLRFRLDVIIDDNNYVGGLFEPDFEYPEDWLYCEGDNYYYYNYICNGSENLEPFDQLNFIAERNNNILNGKSGKIVFTVEILENNPAAIQSLWHTAPTEIWNPTTTKD